MEKYGFVYVWRDKKRDMYYVGCHWGLETDKYICSSTRMRNCYKRRPEDFKRRIVQRVYTNRLELLVEEHKWLVQIKDSELGQKFYNLSKKHCGHWTSSDRADEVRHRLKGRVVSEETKEKIRTARARQTSPTKGRKMSEAFCRAISERQTGTSRGPMATDTKVKISKAHIGKFVSEETRKKHSETLTGVKRGKYKPRARV